MARLDSTRAHHSRTRQPLLLVALLACVSCKASVQGEAKASSSGAEGEVDAFADFDNPAVEDEKGSVGEFALTPETSGEDPALLGARHDVFVKADPVENCSCLSVVAAPADDPRLGWEAKVPRINPLTQMVVAFRMAGCAEATEDSKGATYRGYIEQGNDVLVMVEEANPGRPLIVGAIVPRPKTGGRLLVESVPASLPYAKPLESAEGRCVLDL